MALTFESTDGARSQVDDDHDLRALDILGGVVFGDAREHLAGFEAQVHVEAQEAVGFGVLFGLNDRADAEIEFGEVVEGGPCP